VYSTPGRLAQTASDASAQAQTAALTLSLVASQRLPAPTAETALSDAVDKLGQDDSSLTATDVSGTLETVRRRILARLRTSEDLLARARQLVEAQAGPTQVDVVVRGLRATAKQLSAIDQQLQGSS
jgi:hypothetical protein